MSASMNLLFIKVRLATIEIPETKSTVRLAVCTWSPQIACMLGLTVPLGYTVPDGHTAFVKPLAPITIEHSREGTLPCQQFSSSFLMWPMMHA